MNSLAFGPVPSRRLGRSLGINNIPPKICTYDCVYCQLGGTVRKTISRQVFYKPEEIFDEAEKTVEGSGHIDYLTFVPDGEPTLDINLGKEREMLKALGRTAIITNSSLMWMEDVREDLIGFDLVSVKVDALSTELWKRIDRPHDALDIEKIAECLLEFRDSFKGRLITETMLIGGVDYSGELEKIGRFLSELKPDMAYISVPTRPPSESWVTPPSEELLASAFHEFSRYTETEFLISYEGDDFSTSGDAEKDILSISSVHPLRYDAVEKILKSDGADWGLVESLISSRRLVRIEYSGEEYFVRKLPLR